MHSSTNKSLLCGGLSPGFLCFGGEFSLFTNLLMYSWRIRSKMS